MRGGVRADNYYGQVPSCISNFTYTDYDIFVGSKELKFTWTVTDADAAANSYLYYYVTEEKTYGWLLRALTHSQMQSIYEEMWSSVRGSSCDYTYDSILDEDGNEQYDSDNNLIVDAPDKADGLPYGHWYNNEKFVQHEAWYYGDTYSETGYDGPVSPQWTTNRMLPLQVGRYIDWDENYAWYGHGAENHLQKVALSAGELDLGTITKGCCVFFMMKDASGNNYYGPDQTTNSVDDADRIGAPNGGEPSYPVSGCWVSANFCMPGIVKVSVKADGDVDYREVVAGGDTRFSGTAMVKLELNKAFMDGLGVSYDDYDVVYETDGTSPTVDSPVFSDSDPIEISENTIIHYALKDGSGNLYGANAELLDHTSYSNSYSLPSSIANAENQYYYDEYQFYVSNFDYYTSSKEYQLDIRDKFQWSNTFVRSDAEKKTITLENPVPKVQMYDYWTLNWNNTKYGVMSPYSAWQTWVSDDDYLIPSSLAGYIDFFIYSDADLKLYRVNWLPKDMPVVVRYANLSKTVENEDNLERFWYESTPQTFTVYKGNPAYASASDGRYRLGGYSYYNHLHYYEDGDHAVPTLGEQAEADKYYYGLTVCDGSDAAEWKNITSGNIKARKAFLILQYDGGWDLKPYDESVSEAKPLIYMDGDGVLSHGMEESTTGIHAVSRSVNTDSQLFNLAGQRVGPNYRGLVVKRGKKIFVK